MRSIDVAAMTVADGDGHRRRTPLHEVGQTPDYRFTLANERTFLAWVRTSLALMAAGVGVVQLMPGPAPLRHALGFVLVLVGGALSAVSYRHWEQNERAMRLGQRLPYSLVPRLTAAALALVALSVVVILVVQLAG